MRWRCAPGNALRERAGPDAEVTSERIILRSPDCALQFRKACFEVPTWPVPLHVSRQTGIFPTHRQATQLLILEWQFFQTRRGFFFRVRCCARLHLQPLVYEAAADAWNFGLCATKSREPRQARKGATVPGSLRVPQSTRSSSHLIYAGKFSVRKSAVARLFRGGLQQRNGFSLWLSDFLSVLCVKALKAQHRGH
jgi:hypothetical protein